MIEKDSSTIAYNTRTHAIGITCGYCGWSHNDMIVPSRKKRDVITAEGMIRVGVLLLFGHFTDRHDDELTEEQVDKHKVLMIDSEYLLNGSN